jgi:hypothetical protein
MRSRVLPVVLIFGGLAAVAAFLGWAIYETSQRDGGWQSLAPVWPFVIGGALAVAGLTAVFMWLAFFSSRRGYDDRL